MQPGATAGAVLELHAAKAAGGVSPGINSPLTTTFFDTSGNSNPGTLQTFAGTEASGYAGTGTTLDPYRLALDGASDRVDVGDLSLAEDWAFTYELWIRRPAPPSVGTTIVFCEGNSGTTSPVCYLRILNTSGLLYALAANNEAGSVNQTGATNVCDGNWHHVAAVGDGTNLRLYCDDAWDSAGTAFSKGSGIALDQIAVGCRHVGATIDRYYAGDIAVVRGYPVGLSLAQLQQNYAAGTGWGGFIPGVMTHHFIPPLLGGH